ncbi:MAG: hypothetical protein VW684_12840, partial [Betaproteobacteria bacterium]
DAYPSISLGDLDDTDADGYPNDCDSVCKGLGMDADEDDDGDGVADSVDQYPLISLGGRLDTDGDGIPNDCDSACIATGLVADTDDDGDGVSDADEAVAGSNPLLTDTDGDGYDDLVDAFPTDDLKYDASQGGDSGYKLPTKITVLDTEE